MAHIVLTEEQAKALAETRETVEVRDAQGQVLALLQSLEPQEVEALHRLRKRRASGSSEPTIPSARVQAMLRKLGEIDQQEGITQEKVAEVLRNIYLVP
jgi:hypothetical protein